MISIGNATQVGEVHAPVVVKKSPTSSSSSGGGKGWSSKQKKALRTAARSRLRGVPRTSTPKFACTLNAEEHRDIQLGSDVRADVEAWQRALSDAIAELTESRERHDAELLERDPSAAVADVVDNPTMLLRGVDSKRSEAAAMGRYVRVADATEEDGLGSAVAGRAIYKQVVLIAGAQEHCAFYAGPNYPALPELTHTPKWVIAELPGYTPRLYSVDDSDLPGDLADGAEWNVSQGWTKETRIAIDLDVATAEPALLAAFGDDEEAAIREMEELRIAELVAVNVDIAELMAELDDEVSGAATAPTEARWEWEDGQLGSGQWQTYDFTTRDILTAGYMQRATTPEITMNHGYFGTTGGYLVNFMTMKQKKIQSGYERNIKAIFDGSAVSCDTSKLDSIKQRLDIAKALKKRLRAKKGKRPKHGWEWQHSDGSWRPFALQTSRVLSAEHAAGEAVVEIPLTIEDGMQRIFPDAPHIEIADNAACTAVPRLVRGSFPRNLGNNRSDILLSTATFDLKQHVISEEGVQTLPIAELTGIFNFGSTDDFLTIKLGSDGQQATGRYHGYPAGASFVIGCLQGGYCRKQSSFKNHIVNGNKSNSSSFGVTINANETYTFQVLWDGTHGQVHLWSGAADLSVGKRKKGVSVFTTAPSNVLKKKKKSGSLKPLKYLGCTAVGSNAKVGGRGSAFGGKVALFNRETAGCRCAISGIRLVIYPDPSNAVAAAREKKLAALVASKLAPIPPPTGRVIIDMSSSPMTMRDPITRAQSPVRAFHLSEAVASIPPPLIRLTMQNPTHASLAALHSTPLVVWPGSKSDVKETGNGKLTFNSFTTVAFPSLAATPDSGPVYYELRMETTDVMQCGFATNDMACTSSGGVGDDAYSWGFDGLREKLWSGGGSTSWNAGNTWKKGDTIGFFFRPRKGTITVSINGKSQPGPAKKVPTGCFPAFSIRRGTVVYNVAGDGTPFAYTPKGFASKDTNAALPFALEDLPVGTAVVRGPDWKWEDQDGGKGSVGHTTSVVDGNGWCSVAWPHESGGAAGEVSHRYRVGTALRASGRLRKPQFDLALVEMQRTETRAVASSNQATDVSWANEKGVLGRDIQLSDNQTVTRTQSSGWGSQWSSVVESDCVINLTIVGNNGGSYLLIGLIDGFEPTSTNYLGSSGSRAYCYRANGECLKDGSDLNSGNAGPHLEVGVKVAIAVSYGSGTTICFTVDGKKQPTMELDSSNRLRLFACFGATGFVVHIDGVQSSGGRGSAWWQGSSKEQTSHLATSVLATTALNVSTVYESGSNEAADASLEYISIADHIIEREQTQMSKEGDAAAVGETDPSESLRFVHLLTGARVGASSIEARGIPLDSIAEGVATFTQLMEVCGLGAYAMVPDVKSNGRPIYHSENGRYMLYHAASGDEWIFAQRMLTEDALSSPDKGGVRAITGSAGDRETQPGPAIYRSKNGMQWPKSALTFTHEAGWGPLKGVKSNHPDASPTEVLQAILNRDVHAGEAERWAQRVHDAGASDDYESPPWADEGNTRCEAVWEFDQGADGDAIVRGDTNATQNWRRFDAVSTEILTHAYVRRLREISLPHLDGEISVNLEALHSIRGDTGFISPIRGSIAGYPVVGGDEEARRPAHWAPQRVDTIVVDLDPSSAEWSKVAQRFCVHDDDLNASQSGEMGMTASRVKFRKIQRIQNTPLFDVFEMKRRQVEKRNGMAHERTLFYACGSASGADAKAIYASHHGFDPRKNVGGTSFPMSTDSVLGQASYFSTSALSCQELAGRVITPSGSALQLFVCRVVCGQAKENGGSAGLRHPETGAANGRTYDSHTGYPAKPCGGARAFAIFDYMQAYPEYLVTYNAPEPLDLEDDMVITELFSGVASSKIFYVGQRPKHSGDGEEWTTLIRTTSASRGGGSGGFIDLQFSLDQIKEIAGRATRVRIQSGSYSVTSLPDTWPIDDVRRGRTIGESKGSSCSASDALNVWESDPGNHLEFSSMSAFSSIDKKVYHACNNGNGLHWFMTPSKGKCSWTNGSPEDLDLLVDAPAAPNPRYSTPVDIAKWQAANAGLELGGGGHEFAGDYGTKGLYYYTSGTYKGQAFFGTGGTAAQESAAVSPPKSRYKKKKSKKKKGMGVSIKGMKRGADVVQDLKWDTKKKGRDIDFSQVRGGAHSGAKQAKRASSSQWGTQVTTRLPQYSCVVELLVSNNSDSFYIGVTDSMSSWVRGSKSPKSLKGTHWCNALGGSSVASKRDRTKAIAGRSKIYRIHIDHSTQPATIAVKSNGTTWHTFSKLPTNACLFATFGGRNQSVAIVGITAPGGSSSLHNFATGQLVRIKPSVAVPSKGWQGGVSHTSTGYISHATDRAGNRVALDSKKAQLLSLKFPEQADFLASGDDVEVLDESIVEPAAEGGAAAAAAGGSGGGGGGGGAATKEDPAASASRELPTSSGPLVVRERDQAEAAAPEDASPAVPEAQRYWRYSCTALPTGVAVPGALANYWTWDPRAKVGKNITINGAIMNLKSGRSGSTTEGARGTKGWTTGVHTWTMRFKSGTGAYGIYVLIFRFERGPSFSSLSSRNEKVDFPHVLTPPPSSIALCIGTHGSVGVVSDAHGSLFASSYSHVLGADANSWAWFKDGEARHNGSKVSSAPSFTHDEDLTMCLDLRGSTGTLSLKKGTSPVSYTFTGISKAKALFPAAVTPMSNGKVELVSTSATDSTGISIFQRPEFPLVQAKCPAMTLTEEIIVSDRTIATIPKTGKAIEFLQVYHPPCTRASSASAALDQRHGMWIAAEDFKTGAPLFTMLEEVVPPGCDDVDGAAASKDGAAAAESDLPTYALISGKALKTFEKYKLKSFAQNGCQVRARAIFRSPSPPLLFHFFSFFSLAFSRHCIFSPPCSWNCAAPSKWT